MAVKRKKRSLAKPGAKSKKVKKKKSTARAKAKSKSTTRKKKSTTRTKGRPKAKGRPKKKKGTTRGKTTTARKKKTSAKGRPRSKGRPPKTAVETSSRVDAFPGAGADAGNHEIIIPFEESRLKELDGLSKKELESILVNGEAPPEATLSGHIYRGLNVGLLARLGGVQKFAKGFFKSQVSEDGTYYFGYNVAVRQNGAGREWSLKEKKVRTDAGQFAKDLNRFGYYRVYPVRAEEKDNKYPNALLLNYGTSLNSSVSPTRVLRDYLVCVEPGNTDLLLGKAYFKLGPARILAGYFLLEKYFPDDYQHFGR